ncbi:hypothetical protein ALT721_290003 [Alteromonas alvinellae]
MAKLVCLAKQHVRLETYTAELLRKTTNAFYQLRYEDVALTRQSSIDLKRFLHNIGIWVSTREPKQNGLSLLRE